MVIYLYPDGSWKFAWEGTYPLPANTKVVDIDRWDEYDLSDEQLKMCIEAVDYAESRRSGAICQDAGFQLC